MDKEAGSIVPKNSSKSSVAAPTDVRFGEALRMWIKVGLLSFGGPVGQIATMHRLLVEEKKWGSESRFLHALDATRPSLPGRLVGILDYGGKT